MIASLVATRLSKSTGELRGGDWRPFARAICKIEGLPERMDRIIDWHKLFPPSLESATGVPSAQAKATFLDFLTCIAASEPGTWTDAELDAAEGLSQKDEVL